MKINQDTPPVAFAPITITLETREEAMLLAATIGATFAAKREEAVLGQYGTAVEDKSMYDLYSNLDDILRAG